ncbi:MAG: 3-methyl-2-oxobutanoate hydroxymethyltransferase, partial [candidate division WOR-3 bacterium]|nr:3-methyl-2-oxobutanoate hydroxymethyltransferase [candidate division WOR-3 bacterium]
ALAAAGCFAIILEKVPAEAASKVTKALQIPVIGIGAGPECDGQILVLQDMLGMFEEEPYKFVKRYAELNRMTRQAVQEYVAEVRQGKFPGPEHSFYTDESR